MKEIFNRQEKTSQEKANTWETTFPLLVALYEEIQTLSKKQPQATLNKTKVSIINRLLSDIKIILKDESDDKYLDLIEDENLPQYSDVVIVLSQYSAAMKRFRSKYYGFNGLDTDWFLI